MRKSWAVAGTALLMGAAGIVAAPSAHALSGTVPGCASAVFVVPNGAPIRIDTSACVPPTPNAIGSGSEYVIGDGYIDVTLGADAPFMRFQTNTGLSADVLIYSCSAPIADGTRNADLDDRYWDGLFAGAVDHCDWAVPSSASSADAPSSWFQAYGRSGDEACASGWQSSWAQWPNNGAGGPVCEREIFWDAASGSWATR